MNKSGVIEQIRAVYQAVTTIITPLTPAQLDAQPSAESWSIKDVLGHFIFWDDNFTNLFKSILKLEPRTVLSGTLDEINASTYAAYHVQPPSHVVALFEQTGQGLVAVVELFTEAQLSEPGQFAVSGDRSLGDYIVHEVNGHFGSHMDQLRQLAAEVADR